MAIRMRRGLLDELDESKLLAGEWAVTIDPETNRQKVLMCFGAGIVKQMGTYNDFQQMIEEIADDLLEDFKKELAPIKTEIEQMASDVSSDKAEVVVIKNDITDRILPLIEGYVESAEGFAESAGTSSDNARTYAGNSLESAELSGDYATLAESYTHGGTGKRAGEDTDNAKYYMEQAKAAAGGDYVSRTEIGITVAGLVDGKVPESQLPEIGGKVEVDGTTIVKDEKTGEISLADDITKSISDTKKSLLDHTDALVMSAEGVHGLRYHEDKLEAQDSEGTWHEIETGGGGGTVEVSVDVYSAVGDAVYYYENNDITKSPNILCTTNSEGKGSGILTIPKNGGNILFYSTIADNPNDLSKKYTKIIYVNKDTIEIHVHPDFCVYWYGLQAKPISFGGHTGTHTINTNSITLSVPNKGGYYDETIFTSDTFSYDQLKDYSYAHEISSITSGTIPSATNRIAVCDELPYSLNLYGKVAGKYEEKIKSDIDKKLCSYALSFEENIDYWIISNIYAYGGTNDGQYSTKTVNAIWLD